MNRKLAYLVAILIGGLAVVPALAQKTEQEKKSPGKSAQTKQDTTEFIERYNQRHLAQAPKIGDSIESVKIFDSKGKPFSTDEFKGKPTVLVFGCLT